MILQPGLREDDFDTAGKRAILARAKRGIPPTILLPQGPKNRAANWAFVREVATTTGSGFAIHCNNGSKDCVGHNAKTGELASPLDDDAWQKNKQWWIGELGAVAIAMWGAIIPEKRDPPLRAVILENEWRRNATAKPVTYYQVPETPEMRAAIDRRWTDHINALSVLGPSLNLICYGRGTSDPPVFFGGEDWQDNMLDVGQKFYHVGWHGLDVMTKQRERLYKAEAIDVRPVGNGSQFGPRTTAWVTLGLGYDERGAWHDDGPELYKPATSWDIGQRLRHAGLDNVVIYRAANELHRKAFLRGFSELRNRNA